MHAGGRLLATSQQGGQGEQVHSAVLMQHRCFSAAAIHLATPCGWHSGVNASSSSWLQECKQLHESMRKCVILSPASLLPAPPLITQAGSWPQREEV